LYADGARSQHLHYESRAKNNGDKANGVIALSNEQNLKERLINPADVYNPLVKF
jgi:hypothetical protein